ncbi:MAG: hypothetical protein ACYC27_03735 [Armatimonadota bacterium]
MLIAKWSPQLVFDAYLPSCEPSIMPSHKWLVYDQKYAESVLKDY